MASERFTGLAAVLGAVRAEPEITQSVLTDRVGLGRSVVAERVGELESAGLLVSSGLAPSTGGRAPRRLMLNSRSGFVVAADIAVSEHVVVAADLSGKILTTRKIQIDVEDGPHAIIDILNGEIEAVVAEQVDSGVFLGICVGLPGPVNFDSGVPIEVPVLPGWDGYPVREELVSRWSVPVWVDNRVNLLALAEHAFNPLAANAQHLLYFGAGAGNDAALMIDGRLYRGSHGLAGAIGHIAVPDAGMVVCRCGKVGCLEAVSGGWALTRDAVLLAESGQSPRLGEVLATTGRIRPYDITLAAESGDGAARELLERTATILGKSLASLVSFFAPQLLIIGGGIARAGTIALEPLRTTLHRQLPRALGEDLVIEVSTIDEQIGGVLGAIQLTLDELFTKEHMPALLGLAPNGTDEASIPRGSA